MFSKLSFYGVHAFHETFRLRGPLITILMNVCGITVPLALLLGFSEGLKSTLEQDFLKSPTATEIVLAATGKSGPLTLDRERELMDQIAGIATIIPDITKVVDVAHPKSKQEVSSVTVRCTEPGDPLMAFYGVDVLKAGDRKIVLSRHLADALKVTYTPDDDRHVIVAPNQTVRLTIQRQEPSGSATQRQEPSGTATVELDLDVAAVANFGAAVPIAYLHRDFLNWIDDYQQGRSVDELGWAGYARSADVAYEGYLAFTKQPYQPIDEIKLHANGLKAELLSPESDADQELRTLVGNLTDHDLAAYRLFAEGADPTNSKRPLLSRSSEDIESITDADDVVVPWSTPLVLPVGGLDRTVVGLSFGRRWLKSLFRDGSAPFGADDRELSIRLPELGPLAAGTARLMLPSRTTISLRVSPAEQPAIAAGGAPDPLSQPADPPVDPDDPPAVQAVVVAKPVFPATPQFLNSDVVIVPASLLAHLHAAARGDVTFDGRGGLFVDARTEATYYQARVITTDIHKVPSVDDALRSMGFAPQSQRTRVEEIRRYADTLSLMVYVVGGTVFVFGLFTLCATLADNTLRKQRSLGVLRQMGASRFGLVFIVLVRGLLIGLTSAVVTWPVTVGIAQVLTRFVTPCAIRHEHLLLVSMLSLGSCLLGTVWPVLKVLSVTPLDAVAEGGRS